MRPYKHHSNNFSIKTLNDALFIKHYAITLSGLMLATKHNTNRQSLLDSEKYIFNQIKSWIGMFIQDVIKYLSLLFIHDHHVD